MLGYIVSYSFYNHEQVRHIYTPIYIYLNYTYLYVYKQFRGKSSFICITAELLNYGSRKGAWICRYEKITIIYSLLLQISMGCNFEVKQDVGIPIKIILRNYRTNVHEGADDQRWTVYYTVAIFLWTIIRLTLHYASKRKIDFFYARMNIEY